MMVAPAGTSTSWKRIPTYWPPIWPHCAATREGSALSASARHACGARGLAARLDVLAKLEVRRALVEEAVHAVGRSQAGVGVAVRLLDVVRLRLDQGGRVEEALASRAEHLRRSGHSDDRKEFEGLRAERHGRWIGARARMGGPWSWQREIGRREGRRASILDASAQGRGCTPTVAYRRRPRRNQPCNAAASSARIAREATSRISPRVISIDLRCSPAAL